MHASILLSLLALVPNGFTAAVERRADACGPTTQDQPGSPVDTCNTTVGGPASPPATQIYGVNLDKDPSKLLGYGHYDGTPLAGANSTHWLQFCDQYISQACAKIGSSPPTDQWLFFPDPKSSVSACTVAYFLPKPKDQGGAGALIPSSDVCKYKILEPLRQMLEKETVAEGKSYSTNRVTVNIAVNSLVWGKE